MIPEEKPCADQEKIARAKGSTHAIQLENALIHIRHRSNDYLNGD